MYKKAAEQKLRFTTARGILTVEDLFGLSLKSLDAECRAQLKRMKDSGIAGAEELDFLGDDTKIDPTEQLKFDILKDVFMTKRAEIDSQKKAAEVSLEKQKLMAILKEKQDASLKELSVEELQKKIDALG